MNGNETDTSPEVDLLVDRTLYEPCLSNHLELIRRRAPGCGFVSYWGRLFLGDAVDIRRAETRIPL